MKILSLFAVLISFSTFAQSATPIATWHIGSITNSPCIHKFNSSEAATIYKKSNISTKNIPQSTVLKFASVLKRIDDLQNGQFKLTSHFTIISNPSIVKGYAKQTPGKLEIGPKGINNLAIYTHELAHAIGNQNNRKAYTDYSKFVRAACRISKYASVNHGYGARNEEFAEAFTAYMLHPELLKNTSDSCFKAHQYFSTQLFNSIENKCYK